MIHKIWMAIQKSDCNEMVGLYDRVMSGTGGNLCRARGAFVYTQKCIEQEHDISNLPMKYRVLFPHRYYVNKVRYEFTYWLIVAILTLVLLEFENITVTIWIGLGLCAIVFYPIGLYLLLPEVNKRRVRQQCEIMEKETKEAEGGN